MFRLHYDFKSPIPIFKMHLWSFVIANYFQIRDRLPNREQHESQTFWSVNLHGPVYLPITIYEIRF